MEDKITFSFPNGELSGGQEVWDYVRGVIAPNIIIEAISSHDGIWTVICSGETEEKTNLRNLTRYAVVSWEFNRLGWTDAVRQAIKYIGIDMLADVTGLSKSSLVNWSNGKYHPAASYPNMTNFLAICNILDLDVRDMFQLEDAE